MEVNYFLILLIDATFYFQRYAIWFTAVNVLDERLSKSLIDKYCFLDHLYYIKWRILWLSSNQSVAKWHSGC